MLRSMDECTTISTNADGAEFSGDVDDLIFFHDPDWYASER